MNAVQIHLALNHVPLFLSIIGGGILILGMIKKNESFKVLSLYLLVAAAIFTAPVFLTGEGTEELIEHLPGINESALEKHEEMAKIALIVIIITGLVSLLGLFVRKNAAIARLVFTGALLLSVASFGTMALTTHYGGQIRHSELQNGATAKAEANENGNEEENKTDKLFIQQEKAVKDSLNKSEPAGKKKDEDD